jgi:hypothetical protein
MEYEEFYKLVQESLSDASESEPRHHRPDIAKEIEETMDELNELEELAKKPLN